VLQGFNRSRSTAAVPANAATSVENSSDEILVERIAAGDKLAMQVLFARHRTKLYRWLLRSVGDETVAEDLLSDVFFDLWQQAGRFEGRAAVTTNRLAVETTWCSGTGLRGSKASILSVLRAVDVSLGPYPSVVLHRSIGISRRQSRMGEPG
jgi:hypothetical protein